jgi:hypothetical protein
MRIAMEGEVQSACIVILNKHVISNKVQKTVVTPAQGIGFQNWEWGACAKDKLSRQCDKTDIHQGRQAQYSKNRVKFT